MQASRSLLTFFAFQPWFPQGAGSRRLALARTLNWAQAAPIRLVLGPHFFLPECGLGGGDFLCTGNAAAAAAAGDSHLGRSRLLKKEWCKLGHMSTQPPPAHRS